MGGPYKIIVEQGDSGFSIGTAIAAVAALVALTALWLQGRRLRRQLGHEDMWKLIDRWDGEQLRNARNETAQHMLANWEARDRLEDPALELLDTFELLGYLVVRSKTLSLDAAWINFSGPAIQWWHVCQPGIAKFQADDPTIYEAFTKLVEKLMRLEAKRRNKSLESLKPSDEDLKAFLRGTNKPTEGKS